MILVSPSELSHALTDSAPVINNCVLFCYFALLHASSLICRYGIVIIPMISQRLWLLLPLSCQQGAYFPQANHSHCIKAVSRLDLASCKICPSIDVLQPNLWRTLPRKKQIILTVLCFLRVQKKNHIKKIHFHRNAIKWQLRASLEILVWVYFPSLLSL